MNKELIRLVLIVEQWAQLNIAHIEREKQKKKNLIDFWVLTEFGKEVFMIFRFGFFRPLNYDSINFFGF